MSVPTLVEKRNTLFEQMESLINKAKEETRALDQNEQNQFNQYKEEIANLDTTIESQRIAEELAKKQNESVKRMPSVQVQNPQDEQRMLEEKRFLDFVRETDTRALDIAGNGGIIPTIIADRIIARVYELSPIYARCTRFMVGGDLVFPKYDYKTISVAYVSDMQALTPQNGNFTTVKLQNFIAGALVQVSRSLMNRSDFDLVSFIVEMMSQSIANFLENEFLNGTGTTRALGLFADPSAQVVTALSATALSTTDLIATQMTVPEVFQKDAVWILNKSVFATLRNLKDTTGQHILIPSIVEGGGFQMLGKPVYVSENAPGTVATGNSVLVYGDLSGYYCKLAQQVEVQILNEMYSHMHSTGVVGYVEFDARIVETQKIARLKMA